MPGAPAGRSAFWRLAYLQAMGEGRGNRQASAYAVQIDAPRTDTPRAWARLARRFGEALAAQAVPPVLSAEVAAEVRRGRHGLTVRIAVHIRAAGPGQAASIAWSIFSAAAEDTGGWDLEAASVTARPALP